MFDLKIWSNYEGLFYKFLQNSGLVIRRRRDRSDFDFRAYPEPSLPSWQQRGLSSSLFLHWQVGNVVGADRSQIR